MRRLPPWLPPPIPCEQGKQQGICEFSATPATAAINSRSNSSALHPNSQTNRNREFVSPNSESIRPNREFAAMAFMVWRTFRDPHRRAF
jgi:hypothetical protein